MLGTLAICTYNRWISSTQNESDSRCIFLCWERAINMTIFSFSFLQRIRYRIQLYVLNQWHTPNFMLRKCFTYGTSVSRNSKTWLAKWRFWEVYVAVRVGEPRFTSMLNVWFVFLYISIDTLPCILKCIYFICLKDMLASILDNSSDFYDIVRNLGTHFVGPTYVTTIGYKIVDCWRLDSSVVKWWNWWFFFSNPS